MSNRFADCTDLDQLIYQVVGAASLTWNADAGNKVFNEAEAKRISEECLDILHNGSVHIPASALRGELPQP